MNPLVELQTYGQSFWYDNIRRKLILNGSLQALIKDDGLRGLTSNPSIFEKAIGESDDYDAHLRELTGLLSDPYELYEALALADIRAACDLFAPLYETTAGRDGFVSLEVSPLLAEKSEETIAEARRLFTTVNRPNLMIKVPATPEGIPAIRQLLGEGVNVNITLMFNMSHYEAVAQAYIDGLTHWIDNGGNPAGVASVASFFVSRVDTAVDKRLAALNDPDAEALMGQAAIANARIVYRRFQEIFHDEPFAPLRRAGVNVQRLLWASTSAKNPRYPDTLYIDALIGAETVNTMPPATVDAFRDHGRVSHSLVEGISEAQRLMARLAEWDIDIEAVGEQLQREGVAAFAQSFEGLLQAVEQKTAVK